jgi:multicomponent Na+:H+ antiporter subunit B
MSEPRKPGMSMIVQTVARWLKGLILMFGIYLVLYGHLTPGGGFGGGVTIACAFILVTLAAGRREGQNVFSRQAAARLDSAGLLIFLLLGWLGAWWAGGYFFGNLMGTPEQARFNLFSGGSMPWMNIGLGMKVASALFLVFAVLTAMRVVGSGVGEGADDEE